MIERYDVKEISSLFTETSRFNEFLNIELLVCEAYEQKGKIPAGTTQKIRELIGILSDEDVKKINEIEKTTKHDIIAFLTFIEQKIGDLSRYIHIGLTSYDIVDTALSSLMVKALDIIIEDLRKLSEILLRRAEEFKYTPMIGRSHGVHAEPITFGHKLINFYDETMRNVTRLKRAKEGIAVGKISGAVGIYGNIEPEIEDYVLKRLNLKPLFATTQVISRDIHAEVILALSINAASLEKFATEIRHLQRTELKEAFEFFTKGQKGSSAMPHKKNPILSENVCGLARIIKSYTIAALENIPLWHERDISHSSVERIMLSDVLTLSSFIIRRMSQIFEKLIVFPENMERNLNITKGLYFSESLLLKIVEKGVLRQKAYELVQRLALNSFENDLDFKTIVKASSEIKNILSEEEIESVFDLKHHLRNVDYIFENVKCKYSA
ncbi:MAG: adenylosuccinate lyase [Deltaproteobacteria bacterium]|nr:adenylosuccinate lyase [Deltaproteobacteria bacterium]